jgi:hypothetical protein
MKKSYYKKINDNLQVLVLSIINPSFNEVVSYASIGLTSRISTFNQYEIKGILHKFMRYIEKDEALFELLKEGKVRLLDSRIKKINIFVENVEDLIIEIDFDQMQFKGYYFRLRFSGIKEFSFYNNDKYTFGIVESFSLFNNDNLFYLSTDPEDERLPVVSENDQDYVLCSSFEGYYIDPAPTSFQG